MKKVIDGLRYDTEKAIKIGTADSLGLTADSTSDFKYWKATLYKTPRSGRYFLAGSGGPMTMFSKPCGGNATSGGEDIFQMSADDALRWAEQNLEPEEFEKHFAGQIEDA